MRPDNRNGRPGGAADVPGGDLNGTRIPPRSDTSREELRESLGYLDHFAMRTLQDAILNALPEHYERRAKQLYAVGTPACDTAALACHNAAAFWRMYGPELIAEDLANVWAEFPPQGWSA